MGRLVLTMSVSLDGFMEDAAGGLDWQTVDAELHQHFNDDLRSMGAFVSGRVGWELMAGFWPTADGDPDAPPEVAEFAGIWRDKPKVVYSRTLDRDEWHTTVVPEIVPDDVRGLKESIDGDLSLGGADVAGQLVRLGLVDGYRLYVHPVVLGGGRRMFPMTSSPIPLRLSSTRTFGNGVVKLNYAA